MPSQTIPYEVADEDEFITCVGCRENTGMETEYVRQLGPAVQAACGSCGVVYIYKLASTGKKSKPMDKKVAHFVNTDYRVGPYIKKKKYSNISDLEGFTF